MDDIWDSDGGEPGQLGQIKRDHNNAGYLEGITRSKEESLQPGFDEGYPEGAHIGQTVGQILGTLQGLGLTDLEAAATKELSESSLFCSAYYDKQAKPTFEGTHPLVKKWQTLVATMA